MERVTFRDDAVLDAMARIAVCKLDIDEQQNKDALQRFYDRDGVPAFVVLAEDGRIVHRWSGAVPAQTFCNELANAARLAAPPDPADPIAVAEFHCALGDRARVREQLDVLARRGGAEDAAQADRIEWLLCTTLAKQRRWSDLAAATQGYLARTDGVHRDAAAVLLGQATFALDGTTSAALQAHIDARLAESAVPFPERSLLDRARRFAGLEDSDAEKARDAAATTWVRTVNAAMEVLTELGPPAVPAVRGVLLGGNASAAQHAATVLGWMRLPENVVFLREQLAHGALEPATRVQVVRSLAIHQDPDCMPLLLELAGEANEPAVRAEAIDGIRHLCMQAGGSSDQRVADALSLALRARDRYLREETLQAMFEVHAPLQLPALVAALRDRRSLFADYFICDNALWIFTHQIGRDVLVDDNIAEKCTPEIAAFLTEWFARNEAKLRWDPAAQRWTGAEDDTTPGGR